MLLDLSTVFSEQIDVKIVAGKHSGSIKQYTSLIKLKWFNKEKQKVVEEITKDLQNRAGFSLLHMTNEIEVFLTKDINYLELTDILNKALIAQNCTTKLEFKNTKW